MLTRPVTRRLRYLPAAQLAFVVFGAGNSALAVDFIETRFSSGLLKTFATQRPDGADATSPPHRNAAPAVIEGGEKRAAARFIEREFSEVDRAGYRWREVAKLRDASHTHWTYDLAYDGRRVAGQFLKVHTKHEGWVQYASSSWQWPYSIALAPGSETASLQSSARRFLSERFRQKHGDVAVRIALEPVIWINDRQGDDAKPVPAFEVTMTSEKVGVYRQFFIDERTFETLEEKRILRRADVYKISPLREGATTSETVVGSPTATQSRDSRLIVRREQNATNPELIDVDPTQAFGVVDNDTTDYNPNCVGTGPTDCPNQAFDVVNVFYHLQKYREALDGYYAAIGAPTDVFASNVGEANQDPLQVIINLRSVDLDGDGSKGNETNNAAFIPIPCRADGSIEKCLVFLRPTVVLAKFCGTGQITFNNLAREALVVTHEYQHYVTDTVTKMVAGGAVANVGDALHEGYSDYFAASHISALAGTDVTIIGEYGFEECQPLVRDVAVPRVYRNDADDQDPHLSGLTWASGLWVLRTELGRDAADKLAYKSQFFLSTRPGFVDAVEALVKADDALNAGANRGRIRALFYRDLKFIGGQDGIFRDAENGVAEVGFRSCASVSLLDREANGAVPHLSMVLLVLWLGVTVLLSRLCTRRFE